MTGFQIFAMLLFAAVVPALFLVIKLSVEQRKRHQEITARLNQIEQELARQQALLQNTAEKTDQ